MLRLNNSVTLIMSEGTYVVAETSAGVEAEYSDFGEMLGSANGCNTIDI